MHSLPPSAPHRAPPAAGSRGFTLIEVLIAVAIVAILAAVALPSFLDSIRKSHRTEAFAALSAVQLGQERLRANSTQYTVTLASLVPSVQSPTSSGYYTLTLAAPTADADSLRTGYVATATAAGSQADDTSCAKLAVSMVDGNLRYGSGNSAIDWNDSNRCWAK